MKRSRLFLFFPIFIFSICVADDVDWDLEGYLVSDSYDDSVPCCSLKYAKFRVCNVLKLDEKSKPKVRPLETDTSLVNRKTRWDLEPQQITWQQMNHKNIKYYKAHNWKRYLAGRTANNVDPSDWPEHCRTQLFEDFGLWRYEGYRDLLKSFPEYSQVIVNIAEHSARDTEFRNLLENKCYEEGWFWDSSLSKFIEEELPRARVVVAQQKRQRQVEEDQEIKREENRRARLHQEKINKRAEIAREVFLEQEEKVEILASEISHKKEYDFSEDKDDFLLCKERRMEAFETAIENRFQVEHQTYCVSGKTSSLLEKINIDSEQFEQCTGNAIQQQFHWEFVQVLNNSADLFQLDFVLDKEKWFFTIGSFSTVGRACNEIGKVTITQKISDICQGFYKFGSAAAGHFSNGLNCIASDAQTIWNTVCSYIKEVYESPDKTYDDVKQNFIVIRDGWCYGVESAGDFFEVVKQKSIGRLAKYLSQFLCALKHDPALVLEKTGDLLFDSMPHSLQISELLPALICDPYSEKTGALLSDFSTNTVEPLLKKIEPIGQAFSEMPLKEKFQEICAAGVVVGAVVGGAKLVSAITAGAKAAGAYLSILLSDLSKFSTMPPPSASLALPGGGALSFAVEHAEVLSEEAVAAAEGAIVVAPVVGAQAGVVAENVANVGLTLYNDGLGLSGGGGGGSNITPEDIAAIGDGKIRVVPKGREDEVVIKIKNGEIKRNYDLIKHKKTEKLATRFEDGLRKPKCLERLGLKKIKKVKRLIKHIFGMEHEYIATQNGIKQIDKGLHHVRNWWAEEEGLLIIRNKEIHPVTGIVRGEVWMNEKWVPKTFFPPGWNENKVVDKIIEAIHNVKGEPPMDSGSWVLEECTNCGMRIRTIIRNGEGITSYPLWENL